MNCVLMALLSVFPVDPVPACTTTTTRTVRVIEPDGYSYYAPSVEFSSKNTDYRYKQTVKITQGFYRENVGTIESIDEDGKYDIRLYADRIITGVPVSAIEEVQDEYNCEPAPCSLPLRTGLQKADPAEYRKLPTSV